MRSRAVLFATCLLIIAFLISCGPSEEELGATATAEMISLAATQTAGAPTPTNTPTPTETPTPTSTPTRTPTPTPTPPDPSALLQEALDAQLSSTYHFRSEAAMEMSLEGMTLEMPMSIEGDFQPPGNTRMLTSMELLGEALVVQTIGIGDDVYVWDSGAGEWRYEAEPELPPFISGSQAGLTEASEVKELVYLGLETLDGEPVHHIQGIAPARAFGLELDGDAIVDFFIDLDGLLRKNVIEGELTGSGEDIGTPEVGSFSMIWSQTSLWIDFGQELVIEAPEIAPLTILSTPFGDMARYAYAQPPFSIAYPAHWQKQAAEINETARFVDETGGLLVIAIEDMVAQGLGDWTLAEYADLVVSSLTDLDVEVLAREQIVTAQGEPAELVSFAFQGGIVRGMRFVYVLDNRTAFNATYLATANLFDDLRPSIDYSIGTFWSGEPQEVVSVWHGWGGAYFEEIEAVLGEYGASQEVQIDPVLIYYQGAVQVDLNRAVATGAGPDLLAWWVGGAMEGNIVPITEWVDEEHQYATFEPAAADATIWQDDVWSIPLSQEGIAIVYNKALVSAEELPGDPADFDGLLEAAVDFREANPDKYLLCNQGIGLDSLDAYHVAPIYFGFGGDDEVGFIDEDGNVHVDTPERLAAAEWLLAFAEVAPERTSHMTCLEGMKDGTFAAWWTGPWAIADLEAAGIDYGILPFGRPFMSINRLMMGKNAAGRGHEESVIDLLKYLGSAEVQARLALTNGTIPASSEALARPEVQQQYSIVAFGQAIRTGIPIGNSPYPDAQWDPISEMTRAIISGEQTPEEALAEAQAELEGIIDSLAAE